MSSYVSINQQGLSALGYDLSFPYILSKGLEAEGEMWNGAEKMFLPHSQAEIIGGWRCGKSLSLQCDKCSFEVLFLKFSLFPWWI